MSAYIAGFVPLYRATAEVNLFVSLKKRIALS